MISSRQNAAYWAEWAKCRAALAELGRNCDDSARHGLHVEALGYQKSSKQFTNPELTKVLAKFRSYSDAGNLAAQLKPEEDEEQTRASLHVRIDAAVATCIADRVFKDAFHRSCTADRYLGSTSARMFGRATSQLDLHELRKLTIELEQGAARKLRKAAAIIPAASTEDDGDPF
jgi:hypothetical protein